MSKKIKLKLDEFKVQSFVTDVNNNKELNGGYIPYSWVPMPGCGNSYTCGNPCSNDFNCASTVPCSEIECGSGSGDDPFFGQ